MTKTTSGEVQNNEPWLPNLGHPKLRDHPFNRQWDIFNCRKRVLLISGSRKSGKTWSALHRLVRHLWETPGARVGVFAKSKGLAKDGGSWQSLTDRVIPEWTASNMVNRLDLPFGYTTFDGEGDPGPKQDSITRAPFFRIRNYHGGESECRLFSVEHDQEVEEKVKNKEFSMVYFIELSMFKDRRVLIVTLNQLRMPHLRPPHDKPDQPDIYHQWIADTNPDVDLGDKSWFYDEFYRRRLTNFHESDSPRERERADTLMEYYRSFGVIEMFTKDNPYLTRAENIELEASCEGDQAMYDSYVDGVHGSAGRQKVEFFTGFFSKPIHVIGGAEDESDRIAILPSTSELYTGWDIGTSVNHAAILIQKRFVNEVSYWDILAEEISIGEKIGISEFTQNFLQQLEDLEKEVGRKFFLKNWCDSTAVNVWRPTSESYDALEVLQSSGGRFELDGVDKPSGSVRARVQLIRKLLRQQRLFVSVRCSGTIQMFKELKKGDGKEYVSRTDDAHIFDAISYVTFMECRSELLDESTRRPGASREASAIVGI